MKRKFYLFFFLYIVFFVSDTAKLFAQNVTLQLSSAVNTICNGTGCDYNGPSILINEVMLSPYNGDGSIYGTVSGLITEGEWIELYNPDQCNSVDISCYFLGNNASDGGVDYAAGFLIPQNTVVPPQGFCVIRGILAPAVPSQLLVSNGGKTVEIVLNSSLSSRICLGGGTRLWFPNAGGWFAFYDKFGVPQDAISWNSTFNSCMTCQPCNPGPIGACNYSGPLASYDNIPATRKTYINSGAPAMGYTYNRIPDGGSWLINQAAVPTMGNCNTTCNPPPVITCNGSASVSASGGNPPYTYKWNDVMNQTTQTAHGLCQGTYCVTVTDSQNHTATGCVIVKNFSLQVSATTNTPACQDEDVVINASYTPANANDEFSWTGPGGFQSTNLLHTFSNALPTISGQYILSVTDSNQCFGRDTVFLTVHPTPVITVSPLSAVICKGESVQVTASGGVTYNWPGIISSGAVQVLNPATSTNYTVTGTDVYGCSSTAQVNIDVVDPSVSISPTDPAVCFGDNIQLTATSSGNGISYLWSTGSTSSAIIVAPEVFTQYSVIATDANGCTDTSLVAVNVKPVPKVEFAATPTEGCIPLDVQFVNLSDSGNTLWAFGDGTVSSENDPTHTYNGSGYFSVSLRVTSAGCDSTLVKMAYIYVYPKPIAGFIPSENNVPEDKPKVSFTDLSQGATSWFWDFGTDNPSDVTDIQNPEFTFPGTGTYRVWQFVKNSFGCRDSTHKRIIVKPLETIYFPNAFTPNGDGINEEFVLFGNSMDPDDFELIIYNRWGEQVFYTQNINTPWKGDSMSDPGKILSGGVYIYTARINFDGVIKIHKGIVTLLH